MLGKVKLAFFLLLFFLIMMCFQKLGKQRDVLAFKEKPVFVLRSALDESEVHSSKNSNGHILHFRKSLEGGRDHSLGKKLCIMLNH